VSSTLLSFDSPFPDHPGTIRLFAARDADPEQLRRLLRDGGYHRPFLLDHEGYRGLLFDLDYLQSSMSMRFPDRLELVYSHYMTAFLLFHTRARRLLLLGLGGGSLAKFCHRALTNVDLTAIEYDPEVIAFRDAFAIPPDDERFSVVQADAAAYLAEAGMPFDVILMDAFDGRSDANGLVRPGFYESLRARLDVQGWLVANITGEDDQRRRHLDLIREAFGDNLLLARVDGGSNHILLCCRDARVEPRWKWIDNQAEAMNGRYGRFGIDFRKIAADFRRSQDRGWEAVY
jgi:spermidine synthase